MTLSDTQEGETKVSPTRVFQIDILFLFIYFIKKKDLRINQISKSKILIFEF